VSRILYSAFVASLMVSVLMCFDDVATAQSQAGPRKWAVVVHGGAGVIEKSSMTPEAEAGYRAGITEAINAAAAVLDKGGSSVDAVEAAIKLLEDNPMFNAGRGAVFAADGTNQLDAAIMDGKTMQAGAVADVQRTRLQSLWRALSWRSRRMSCWSDRVPTNLRQRSIWNRFRQASSSPNIAGSSS